MLFDAIHEILDEVSSASPAPGGGSVSALAGANGAALVAMVCRLTLGKKKYEHVAAEVENLLARAGELQNRLAKLAGDDSQAFEQVMAAVKMPKETPEQIEARNNALQAAYRHATTIPLETARACAEGMVLAETAARIGNTNALSDAGVASLMFEAGAQGARLNVLINLGGLEDTSFAAACRSEADTLVKQANDVRSEVLHSITKRLTE